MLTDDVDVPDDDDGLTILPDLEGLPSLDVNVVEDGSFRATNDKKKTVMMTWKKTMVNRTFLAWSCR
jgi:hypothetical protein